MYYKLINNKIKLEIYLYDFRKNDGYGICSRMIYRIVLL